MPGGKREDISLQQRFCNGVIDTVKDDCLEIRLERPVHCIRRARIHPEHLPEGMECRYYQEGESVELFLMKETQADIFHASMRWADREANPWLRQLPVLGQCFIGKVIRFLPDYQQHGTYAGAFVRLQPSGIEALLRITDVPGGSRNICDVIDKGDLVYVAVSRVDAPTLEIAVSIHAALRQLLVAEQLRRQQDVAQDSWLRLVPRKAWAKPAINDHRVAILTPDIHFSEHLRNWLEVFGIAALRLKSLEHASRILQARNHPTELLMSARCWVEHHHSPLEKSLLRQKVRLLWLEDAQTQPPALKTGQLVPLATPLDIRNLVSAVLRRGKRVDITESDAGTLYFDDYQRKKIQQLMKPVLEEICATFRLHAAMWVVMEREGVFTIRVVYNLDLNKLQTIQAELSQTMVNSCLASSDIEEHPVTSSGILARIAPSHSTHIHAIPFSFEMEGDITLKRVLLLFHAQSRFTAAQEIHDRYQPAFRAYMQMLAFAIHNETMARFAAMGLNSAAYLHEIGVAAAPLHDQLASLRADKAVDSNTLQSMRKEVAHLIEMTQGDQSVIRRKAKSYVNIHELISHVCQLSSYAFARHQCALLLDVPDYPLALSLPANVIDQALRNVLSNALYFVRQLPDGLGRVQVRVRSFREAQPPFEDGLCIDVEDNGPGVRADMVKELFSPLFSEKGEAGSGMGLFISRNLLRSVGGDLKYIESVRWQTTRFRICLPMPIRARA